MGKIEQTTSEEKLVRAVGLVGIVALTINGIIGAGIFALPANIARMLGVNSPIAFLIAGLFSMIIVLCFAELGGKFDRTGGAYLYALEAFGGSIAFLIGWMYFLSRLTAIAALSNAMVGFIGYFVNTGFPIREFIITLMLLFLGVINILGIRTSTRFINFLTVIKLLALVTFIVVGMFFVKWDVFTAMQLPPFQDLTTALLLVMFAFTGFEVIAIPGGEMVNPKRNLPLGILLGTGITILIYLLIQVVAVGTYPPLATSSAPIADAATSFLGPKGGMIISAGAVFSTIGTLTSLLLTGPRILYAMGLNRQMPNFFSKIHAGYRTPYLSIAFCTVLSIVCTLSSTFQDLATLSAMARLITYIGTAAAVLVIRKKIPTKDSFHISGGPVIPIVAILLSVFLLTAATEKHLITGTIATLVGFALYFVTSRTVGRSQS